MRSLAFFLPDGLDGGFFPRVGPRRWLMMVMVFACCAVLPRATAEEVTRDFEIPAGPAHVTLRQFSAQAGVQLVFPTDLVTGVRTNSIDGRFTPLRALDRMLKGTRLVAFREPKTGALGIRKAGT